MQRKLILSMKLAPPKFVPKEESSNSDTSGRTVTESSDREDRFPSRLRTTTGTGNTERSAADRRNELLTQQLKSINTELQSKLRTKTLENSQLKLELSKIRSEHDKDVRMAVLQQKKSTEMMARTLKHAEDVIKEKEQMISRQQEIISKMNMARTSSPRVTPPSSSSSLVTRGQSFHGRTNNQKAAAAAALAVQTSAEQDKPVHKFARSASLRSNNNVSSFASASRKLSLASQKQPSTQPKQQEKNKPDVVPRNDTNCILDLSQKSSLLRKINEESRSEYDQPQFY